MQDPYSAMMGGQQRGETGLAFKTEPGLPSFKTDPGLSFKSFNRAGSATSPSSATSSYYHGLNYGTPSFSASENFSSMTIPASINQDYSPMPAHMQTTHSLHHSADMPRHQLSAHTVSHLNQTVTSPQATSTMGHHSSPPMPSTSRVESISPEHDRSGSGHISSSSPGEISMSKDFSDNSSEKSGDKDEDSQGVPPKKRAHSMSEGSGSGSKDESYWDKRKKNNESAKRSREARRMKEEQIALRVVYLEQENLQLRTEVSLLKSEIEKLRCMLYNS